MVALVWLVSAAGGRQLVTATQKNFLSSSVFHSYIRALLIYVYTRTFEIFECNAISTHFGGIRYLKNVNSLATSLIIGGDVFACI